MIIIGSGPSAANFTPPDDAIVMAVNGALDRHPSAEYFFTLDPSPVNCERLKRRACIRKYAAIDDSIDMPKLLGGEIVENLTLLTRISNNRNVCPEPKTFDNLPDTGSPRWWLWRWGCALGFSDQLGEVHTGNSMYGALNLAYTAAINKVHEQMFVKPFKKIMLVGLDGSDKPRLEGGTPNNLSHLPPLFSSAMPQILKSGLEVVNASPGSAVRCFPVMSHENAIEWYLEK